MKCNTPHSPCGGVIIVVENEIEYDYYQIQVRFPNPRDSFWIEDVQFNVPFDRFLSRLTHFRSSMEILHL